MNIKKTVLYASVVLSMGILSYSCKEAPKKVMITETVTFTKEGSLQLLKSETDSVLASLDIEIAETDYETQTGLMYRDTMEDNQGMLFIFPDVAYHSFYMKNTKIPLDIIYIDENLRIASIVKNAQPMNETSLSSGVPVQYVLEVNAGLTDSWKVTEGDRITFQKLPEITPTN
ncbi:MAG: DUF192 domain-containing protein [Eudoraea sp.]|nr:DUF192 domain-containing protein [Eudoraea sp.]